MTAGVPSATSAAVAHSRSTNPKEAYHALCGHDAKVILLFAELVKCVTVKRVGPLAPNLNAYAEPWVQSVEQECLDRFVMFGEAHLRHLVGE